MQEENSVENVDFMEINFPSSCVYVEKCKMVPETYT